MKFSVESEPAQADREALSEGIKRFNAGAIPDLEPVEAERRFHVFVRDEAGAISGGLRAACYWNTLHIELLWLAEDARATGAGTELVRRAEDFAREQGCAVALVETTSWQARPFYERCGYRFFGTVEGRPKGHATHYLSKGLG